MIKKLANYAAEFKKETILTPVYVVLEVAMETIIPLLMAMIIDNGVGKGNVGYVTWVGAAMILAAFLSLTFGVLGGKHAAKASTGFARNLRKGMYYNIQNYCEV